MVAVFVFLLALCFMLSCFYYVENPVNFLFFAWGLDFIGLGDEFFHSGLMWESDSCGDALFFMCVRIYQEYEVS